MTPTVGGLSTGTVGEASTALSSAAQVALQSLSHAMVSAEQQLQVLQDKQQQLLKLQQQVNYDCLVWRWQELETRKADFSFVISRIFMCTPYKNSILQYILCGENN